jgi:hypothetical protein
MMISAFRDVMPCSLVDSCQRFGGTLPQPSTLKIEAAGFSETLMFIYQAIRRLTQEQ